MMSPGINLYKLDSQGNILWRQHIGPGVGIRMQKVVYSQNMLFVTGTFYANLTFSPTVAFSHPYSGETRAFIAKYDTDGNFVDATELGGGLVSFGVSEVDPLGNTYVTYKHLNYQFSRLEKYDLNLNLVWSDNLTTPDPNDNTPGVYDPTGIRFNAENQKLYIWGGMCLDVNIMGTPFFISTSNGIFQSALTEFDAATGALTNIARFDNNSSQSVPAIPGTYLHPGAFMLEKAGQLYVLTSFRDTMVFPNATITSTSNNNGQGHSEELLLFKVNLSDFSPEMLFKSQGVQNLNYATYDLPGEIVFNGDDLYLTSTFTSNPMLLNGSQINNNSGNNNSDGMLYKFNIFNAPASGSITMQHTCLNQLTDFNIAGSFDSVSWNFGEPASPNNTSSATNPQHQYAAVGSYHVTAMVTCGGFTQTIATDVVITQLPLLGALPTQTACEDSHGSGISSGFDTAQLNNLLIGTQTNVTLAFSSGGQPLPSPLPNPFTNSFANHQSVTVRAFFTSNPDCYVEQIIDFSTLAAPVAPTAPSTQQFCVQQAATISNLAITGQNIKWYDAASGGNLLQASHVLTDGTIYYASQTTGGCESARVAIAVDVQNTAPPAGSALQTFCLSQNPTLSQINLSGTAIQWYDSAAGGAVLADNTVLSDGMSYFASQTVNGCESPTRTTVNVNVIATINANDYSQGICDEANDGLEVLDLSQFEMDLVAAAANHTFAYYQTATAAQSAIVDGLIASPTAFELHSGTTVVYVRIIAPSGCYQVVRLTLALLPSPVIAMPDVVGLCENRTVRLDAGPGFDNYLWSDGSVSQSIMVSQSGNYSVTVSQLYAGTNCSATKGVSVVMSDLATITEIAVSDLDGADNTIIVHVSGIGDYEYSLDGLNYQDNNSFLHLAAGVYDVHVRDKNGCGTVTQQVAVLSYPNYFTPNGDGINDYWSLQFGDSEPGLEVSIFDRYGKLLHKMSPKLQWDGRYDGRNLPADDYWFSVTRANGKQYRGHFTLKR